MKRDCAAHVSPPPFSSTPLASPLLPPFPSKDPTAAIPARVNDLLAKMTLQEKTAQLSYGYVTLCDANDAKRFPNGVGGVAAITINCTNGGQKALIANTRLGIPAS